MVWTHKKNVTRNMVGKSMRIDPTTISDKEDNVSEVNIQPRTTIHLHSPRYFVKLSIEEIEPNIGNN